MADEKKTRSKKTAAKTKKRAKSTASPSTKSIAPSHWHTRVVWAFVALVILVAALFYFSGLDPREVLPNAQSVLRTQLLHTPDPSAAVSHENERNTELPPSATEKDLPSDQSNAGFTQLLPKEGELSVLVLDVGQGNAVFIQTPEGNTALVDTGEAAYAPQLKSYLDALGVKRIDALIGTHPHSDHIGGMRAILETYEVSEIYMPRAEHTSNTYIRLLETIRDQGKKIHMTRGGMDQTLSLDPSVTIRILAPLSTQYASLNDYSICLHVSYEGHSMLLTADAERISEKEMLETVAPFLSSDVYLLGHHGSSTSNSAAFLDAVNPEAAIVSCGKDNDYGHPHKEVLDRLQKRGIPLYRTDQKGSIGVFFSSDDWEIRSEKP